MSRFGWAYVNDIVTGSGGTPGGLDKQIQFNSGSTFSGSTNLTFDYTSNTLRLTGTLYADNLIVSSSTIFNSGSTKFGDDSTDTHQFTGSLLLSSSYISQTNYIDFNVSASAPSHKNGRVYWDNTDGCLAVYNNEADITLQVGQENWTRIFNDSGVLISNGTAVRLNGTHGDVPTAVKAQSIPVSGAVNIYNQILGLATHDIEVNTFGYITTQGLVRGLNTNAFNDGDMLFVSTSAGLLTNTPPSAPYEIIPIGVCVKASPGTSGIIYVAVQQPTDFSDLSSVYVSGTYHYGDLLTYVSSSTTGYWTHTNQLSGAYGVTGSINVVGTINATSNITSTSGLISASSGLYSGDVLNVAGISTLKNNLIVTGSVGIINGNVTFVGNTVDFSFAEDDQFLIKNDGGGNLLNITSPVSGRNQITIGNLDAAKDTTVTIQGIGDDYFNITIPTSGTTAQFTSITGTLNGTASYALNADLFDGRNSTTFASTGSNIFVGDQTVTGNLNVSGVIDTRGIPFVSSLTSQRRTIQLFPGAGSMMNTVSPIDSTANSPFTQGGTATQAFSNGYAIIGYAQSSTSTYGITTQDVGSTKLLCTPQRGPNWKGGFRTGNDLTSKRIFVGFEEYAGNKDADDPSNGYAHLSYSSVRGDTTFKIITRTANGVGSQTLIDTGISASASTNYYFDMKLTSGSFDVTLTSGSSTYVGSVTSSLPNVTASLGTCAAAKNTTAVSRTFSIYFLEFNDS